jgi:hypothetical protein
MSHPVLEALNIQRAPSDSDKAILLGAISTFAKKAGDSELFHEAQALMRLDF